MCWHKVETVKNKYLKAVENIKESQQYFEELSQAPTAGQITAWTQQIEYAESRRSVDPDAMDVMQPKVPKGTSETGLFDDDCNSPPPEHPPCHNREGSC